jgi:AraC family transcriptional regulator
MDGESIQTSSLHLKGMVCNCCIQVVKELLESKGAKLLDSRLGEVVFQYDNTGIGISEIEHLLESKGFEVVRGKEKVLVNEIKTAVIELIHHANYSNSLIRNSDYLVDKLGYSYSHLTNVFSKYAGTTLEKFIILHKIEKVKELIEYGELSLSEIADMMGYSSGQYLSNQFKSVVGISISEYKRNESMRKPLESL